MKCAPCARWRRPLAYNFNNTTTTAEHRPDDVPAPVQPAPARAEPATSDSPQSAALVRFRSCRWMQAPEHGNAAFCTHREVKPYAGTLGFEAEAWCPECQYYKLRRAPRKRPAEDESYRY